MEYPSRIYESLLANTARSTLYSRSIKWFLEHYVTKTKTPKERVKAGYTELEPGKIYTYNYDPITKDKLSFYDNMPMNFIIGHIETKKGRRNPYGINLSFIPPRVRMKILDKLVHTFMDEIDENRRVISKFVTLYNHAPIKPLDISYDRAKLLLKGSGFEFAIRSYIYDQMKTEPMIITYDEWYRLGFFPSQFIEKMNMMAIYGNFQRKMKPDFKFTPKHIKLAIKK